MDRQDEQDSWFLISGFWFLVFGSGLLASCFLLLSSCSFFKTFRAFRVLSWLISVFPLTAGHQAKVEEKPEVRKAGGVYYTPAYIVDYIVKNTVGKKIEGKSPAELAGSHCGAGFQPASGKTSTKKGRLEACTTMETTSPPLRILDMACGSGSFLLGAYQLLLDHCLKWYLDHGPDKYKKQLYEVGGPDIPVGQSLRDKNVPPFPSSSTGSRTAPDRKAPASSTASAPAPPCSWSRSPSTAPPASASTPSISSAPPPTSPSPSSPDSSFPRGPNPMPLVFKKLGMTDEFNKSRESLMKGPEGKNRELLMELGKGG